ncbi:MAG TPA: FAD binding domain-containing protein [Blastococcus sp.]
MIEYAAPSTTAEALELLRERPAARVVAGGTDLVVAARGKRHPLPDSLIALHAIADLAERHEHGADIELGALTSHEWIEQSPLIRSRWSALADASAMIGSPATRATGTIGGNLMNASPAMDTGSPLLVLDATVELQRAGGSRRLTVAELLTGPGRTSAARDELLCAVHLPAPAPGTGSAYVRLEHRQAMEIAIVGAAAALRIGPDGLIGEARLALTAVAPTCLAVPAAAALLVGCRPDDESFARAADAAAAAVQPIDDVRASAAYRRAMTVVVLVRALTRAAERAVADIHSSTHDHRPLAGTGRNP